jgi:hypothetical protein
VIIILLISADQVFGVIVPVEVNSGSMSSIQFTVAVVSPVLPARSSKVKRKLPSLEKIYAQVFIHVSVSLNPVSTATTFPLVRVPGV